MKFIWALTLLLCVAATGSAQQSDTSQTKLTVRSDLVMVPVFVTTGGKDSHVVFDLAADDFFLTDNGVPQTITLEQETDSEPLALAIVVQTGGAGSEHLTDYRDLGAILDALIGNVEHRVAVIGFDSAPHLILPFTPDTEEASRQLATLSEGDQGAAILDGVAFGVAQLRTQPARYRRAILLLSETIDQGSETTLDDALRLTSDTNTTIYSFAFSSTRSAIAHEAGKLNNHKPGPAHGCFSRNGADSEYEGHYSKQVLDCLSQLAPPLRLATMAFLTARNGLRTNTAESLAQLAGGEFRSFHNVRDLKSGLIAVSNDVPNFYVLSFTPTMPTSGLHALRVESRRYPQLEMKHRQAYWIDDKRNSPRALPTRAAQVPYEHLRPYDSPRVGMITRLPSRNFD